MNNEAEQAAAMHETGQGKMFEFAIKCSSFVGLRDGSTAETAKLIRRSVSYVEKYAHAGSLWLALLQAFPARAEVLRSELSITYWLKLGAMFNSELVTIDGAKAWLDMAIDNGWTVEEFWSNGPANKVPTGRAEPITRLSDELEELYNRPQWNIPDRTWNIVAKLIRKAIELVRLAESGGSAPDTSGTGKDEA